MKYFLILMALNHGQITSVTPIPMADYETCEFALHMMQMEVPLAKLNEQCVESK